MSTETVPPTAPPPPGSGPWVSDGPPMYGSSLAGGQPDQYYPAATYRQPGASGTWRRAMSTAAAGVETFFLSQDQIPNQQRVGTLPMSQQYTRLPTDENQYTPSQGSRGRQQFRRRANEFVDTLTMRPRNRTRVTVEPTRQEILDSLPNFWPICTILISLVQIGMFIAVCVAFGLAPIQFVPGVEDGEVTGFNGLNETVTREIAPNFFVGPSSESLVHVGAQYTPCMRENQQFLVEAARARNQELNLRCCRNNLGSCGMIPLDQCLAIAGSEVLGGASVCRNESQSPYRCSGGVTLRPCCTGILGHCSLTTISNCSFQQGNYHDNNTVCSEVGQECFAEICSFTWSPGLDGGQGIRFVTAIFLHRGVVDLIIVLLAQLYICWRIERRVGWLRVFLMYIISGIGGFLVSGFFDPNSVSVGASGSLFGLLGVLLVELLQGWKFVKRPWLELIKLLILDIVLLLLGTLPYIDNFANIGGFITGTLSAFILVPYITVGKWDRVKKLCLILTALPIMGCLFLIGFVFFYNWPDPNFCPECSYINCIPFTPTFCDDFIGTLRNFVP